MPKKGMTEKPCIGQGRIGLRRKHVPGHIDQPFDVTRRIPERSKTVTGRKFSISRRSHIQDNTETGQNVLSKTKEP